MADPTLSQLEALLRGIQSDVPQELASDFDQLAKALTASGKAGSQSLQQIAAGTAAYEKWDKAIREFMKTEKGANAKTAELAASVATLTRKYSQLAVEASKAAIALRRAKEEAEGLARAQKRLEQQKPRYLGQKGFKKRPQIMPPMWEGGEGKGTTLGMGFGAMGRGPSKRTMQEAMKRLNAAWDRERKQAEDRQKLGKELGRTMKMASEETTLVKAAWKRLRRVLREIGRKLTTPPGGGKGIVLGMGFGAMGGKPDPSKETSASAERMLERMQKALLRLQAELKSGIPGHAERTPERTKRIAELQAEILKQQSRVVSLRRAELKLGAKQVKITKDKVQAQKAATKATKEEAKAQRAVATQMKKARLRWTEFASQMRVGMEAARRVADIFDFGESIRKLDDLNKKALEFGVSVETLSELGFIAERQGTSLDVLTAAMGKLQANLFMVAAGSKDAMDAFKVLGISVSDLERLDAGGQFLRVAGALEQIDDIAMRARLSMRIFGRNKEMLRFIAGLQPGSLAAMGERARAVGAVVTTAQAAEGAKAADAMTDLQFAIDAFQRTLLIKVTPTLIKFVDQLTRFFRAGGMEELAIHVGSLIDNVLWIGKGLFWLGEFLMKFRETVSATLALSSPAAMARAMIEGRNPVAELWGALFSGAGGAAAGPGTAVADQMRELFKGGGAGAPPSGINKILRGAMVMEDIEKFQIGLQEQADSLRAITESEKLRLSVLKEQRGLMEQVEAFIRRGADPKTAQILREHVQILGDIKREVFDDRQMAQAAKWWEDIAKSAGDTTRAMERQTAIMGIKSPFAQDVLGARAERERMEADLRALQLQMQEQMARMRRERGTLGEAEERLFRGDVFQPLALRGRELLTPEQNEILNRRAEAIMRRFKASLDEAAQKVEPFGEAFTRGLGEASIGFQTDAERMTDFAKNLASTLVTTTSSAFTQFFETVIAGTEKTSDAFRAMGRSIISSLLQVAQNEVVSELWGLVFGAIKTVAGGVFAGGATPMAEGGIVTRPTYGLVGEAGPEAVIPLSKVGAGGFGGTVNQQINIYSQPGQDEQAIAEMAANEVVRKMRYSQGYKSNLKSELRGGL